MATLSPIILLLLLSISLFPLIVHGDKEKEKRAHALIHNTCKTSAKKDSNVDYAFCTAALQARTPGECDTLRHMGMTVIKLIMSNATDTRRHIKDLVKRGKVKKSLKRCVDECYEHYTEVVPHVGEALRYFKHKRYNDADTKISAVMEYAVDCEDLFVEKSGGGCGGGASPFPARNYATFELSAMALSVMHLIKEGKLH